MKRRKAPPLARSFILPEGKIKLAWLYCGPFAWDGKNCPGYSKQQTLILPPGDDPALYDWKFINGAIVFCMASGTTEKTYRKSIATELFIAGAVHVRFLLPPVEVMGINCPDFNGDTERERRERINYLELEYPQDAYFLSHDRAELKGLLCKTTTTI
jgi:hypothetical protein